MAKVKRVVFDVVCEDTDEVESVMIDECRYLILNSGIMDSWESEEEYEDFIKHRNEIFKRAGIL